MNLIVSIIVPIYNCEKYLEQCILSILKQSYKNIEIILINDGSEDKSHEIAFKYAKLDSRIKYVTKKNEGVSKTRNLGIKLASGDYVTFVDADDFIEEKYIEDMILECKDMDFVMTGYKIWNMKNNECLKKECPYFYGNINEFVEVIFNYINVPFLLSPCFKLFRLEILKKNEIEFPEDISFGEDALFVLEYLKNIKKIKCMENVNYIYRRHGKESLSTFFREDKINIFYRICCKLDKVISKYNIKLKYQIKKMFLQNFISYLQEVFCSEITYRKKKMIFYKKFREFGIDKLCIYIKEKSLAQKMVWFSYKTKLFLPTYIGFKINNLKRG